MKNIIFLIILLLVISCNENKRNNPLNQTTQTNQKTVECNHSPDYGFCDNLDTAIAHSLDVTQLIIFRKSYSILPIEIEKLINLKGLTIKDQPTIIWADAFDKLFKLDSLTSIEINNCRINNLTNIYKLKDLNLLTIFDSQTTIFPSDLIKCRKLKSLQIICPFYDIPDEIGSMYNLENLSITLNTKKLPQAIARLSNLKTLDIGGKIEMIPNEIVKLRNLEKFSLYDTPIGKEELANFRKYHEFKILKYFQTRMPKCKFVVEAPLPPI